GERLAAVGEPVTEPDPDGGGEGVLVGAGAELEAADDGAGLLGLGELELAEGPGLAGGGGLGVDAVAAGPVCAPGGRVVDDLFAFAPADGPPVRDGVDAVGFDIERPGLGPGHVRRARVVGDGELRRGGPIREPG